LIVDDSPTDRQFFMETLSKHGYQVVTAENGDEAIIKSKSEKPDLILMDVVMRAPMASGDACHYARRGDQAHPGDCRHEQEPGNRSRLGMRQGAKDYLMKPIDAKELLAKIAAVK